MTFTVTYRGNDGSMATASIEAKDRSECFVRCKERGIVPTDIREGRAKTHPLTPNALLSARRLIAMGIAGAVALALVIGAWLWMASGKRPKEEPARPAPPAQAVPPKKVSKTKPTTPPATNHVSRLVRHRKPKTVPTVTAEVGTPPDLPMFEEAPRRYGEINGSNIWPRALFKTREENMIAGLLTAKPGSRIVLNGFLPGEEERLLASLDIPVEFEDIDTPDERRMKEYMIGVKADLKEAVAKGEKITDIVQSLRNELNELANYRDKLRMAHSLMMKEGTPQDAETFRQEANKMLSEYGMDPIPIRSTQRARLGLDP